MEAVMEEVFHSHGDTCSKTLHCFQYNAKNNLLRILLLIFNLMVNILGRNEIWYALLDFSLKY